MSTEFDKAVASLVDCAGKKKATEILAELISENAEQIVKSALDDFSACNLGHTTIASITDQVLEEAEWQGQLESDWREEIKAIDTRDRVADMRGAA